MHNFDEIIDRQGTNTYKYDLREKIFGTDDVYPMWVADTEFKAPVFIYETLKKRIEHGVFGYTILDDGYFESIIRWLKQKHSWNVEKSWIKYSPGVVPSVFASVLAYTQPGDKVIIQPPVYHPFYYAVKETGRELVKNPLVLRDGRYYMDFEDLKSKIDGKTKMMILCSPHNPTGNVWRKEELVELCQICLEKNILLISDEIHADIVYNGFRHTPTALVAGEMQDKLITLMAPSKTFNIAGLNSSYVVASNHELLDKLNMHFEGLHIGPTIFAIEATKAAYNYGLDWVEELIRYFSKNLETVKHYIHDRLPKIDLIEPEGTFLLWLDFRKFGLERKDLLKLLVNEAKVGLSDGFIFGSEGEGFQRMNIGCANSELIKSLDRIYAAFKKI
ncbi:MAG: PatB family C-S lyase [Bacteroidales bacterium]|nr:PatB family C-S lyase [Bacteroidales bacterium]MBN2819253.1 PatB family C-S lyase [Bacteroidales bacterium]